MCNYVRWTDVVNISVHICFTLATECAYQAQSDLTCKRGSVGQSEGLSIPRSSVRFRQKSDNSNSHEFELHRPSNKGTKLLLKVIKAIIIIYAWMYIYVYVYVHV